jgi:hypothetical protein
VEHLVVAAHLEAAAHLALVAALHTAALQAAPERQRAEAGVAERHCHLAGAGRQQAELQAAAQAELQAAVRGGRLVAAWEEPAEVLGLGAAKGQRFWAQEVVQQWVGVGVLVERPRVALVAELHQPWVALAVGRSGALVEPEAGQRAGASEAVRQVAAWVVVRP